MAFLGLVCTPELGARCSESTFKSDLGKTNLPPQSIQRRIDFGQSFLDGVHLTNSWYTAPNCCMAWSRET